MGVLKAAYLQSISVSGYWLRVPCLSALPLTPSMSGRKAHSIVSQQRKITKLSPGEALFPSFAHSLSLAPTWAPCSPLRQSPAWAGTSLFLSHLIPASTWGICPGTLAKTCKCITSVMTAHLMLSEFRNLPQLLLCQNPWSCKIL